MANAHLDLQNTLLGGLLRGRKSPAAAVHELPSGSRVSVLTGIDEFMALESRWRELEATSASPRGVFQSFDWLRSWTDVYASIHGRSPLCIFTGYRDDKLVFAWPMMRTKLGPITVLRWLSDPFSQYGDVLTARGECSKAWMAAAMRLMPNISGVDAIWLRHVRADASAASYLLQNFRNARHADQAPWLDLSAFADEAAYEARYTSAQRKRRKKIRKSLEDDLGPVAFTVLSCGPASEASIDQAVAEKSRWLDARGRHNRVLCCPFVAEFLKSLSRGGSSTKLVVSSLTAGGNPVSWEIGLRHGGTHYGFITSHVSDLTDHSPARLHMDLSQRQALKDGMSAFDLMLPNDAHKESWSSARTDTADYHLPLTAAGWAYGCLYLETLRPVLREAYHWMPPGLLRLLKPILGH